MLDPRSSQLGSTTDQQEMKQKTIKIFIELPLELVHHLHWYHRHLQLFGSIYESRGLNNLKPARSRLFKLMGRIR